jgi:hypothetical protein
LYFSPNLIRIVKDNEMDRASNKGVLEEECIKMFCEEKHFENLGIQDKATLTFILHISRGGVD